MCDDDAAGDNLAIVIARLFLRNRRYNKIIEVVLLENKQNEVLICQWIIQFYFDWTLSQTNSYMWYTYIYGVHLYIRKDQI